MPRAVPKKKKDPRSGAQQRATLRAQRRLLDALGAFVVALLREQLAPPPLRSREPLGRPPEVVALDAFRLERGWSWPRLAADMRRWGLPVPMRTLHYLGSTAPPGSRPTTVTLYKIRRYLRFHRRPIR